MNLLFPKISLRSLPLMLAISVLGALVAGAYGILHDQITYSISPEYFTKMKFAQFYYANFHHSDRVFAATIGFLATWWVGFAAGWFIARITVPQTSKDTAIKQSLYGFAVIFGFAIAAAFIGFILGILHTADYSYWAPLTQMLSITEVPDFVTVAYIHNASYIGGVIGLIASIILIKRRIRTEQGAAANPYPLRG